MSERAYVLVWGDRDGGCEIRGIYSDYYVAYEAKRLADARGLSPRGLSYYEVESFPLLDDVCDECGHGPDMHGYVELGAKCFDRCPCSGYSSFISRHRNKP